MTQKQATVESELMPTVCTVERSGYGSILTANSTKFAGDDGVQGSSISLPSYVHQNFCITNIAWPIMPCIP